MEFRPSALAHDTQYLMDGALDCSEINSFVYAIMMLWGEQKRIDKIWEESRPHKGRGWLLGGRRARCLALSAYAHEIAADMPVADRRALFAFDLANERKTINDYADFYARSNFEDQTVGGAMQPFRNGSQIRMRRVWIDGTPVDLPTKGILRHLCAPRAIARHVKINLNDIVHYRDLTDAMRKLPWPSSAEEGRDVLGWMDEQRVQAAGRTAAVMERVMADHRALVASVKPAPRRGPTRDVRKRIIRAASMATTFLGASAVSAFAAGAPVEIRGETVLLEATGRPSNMGHGSLDVRVKSLEGRRLANLCVFFDKTPAIDQLVALKLHFDAGEEKAVLDKGNLFNITPEGAAHPIVLAHHKPAARQRNATQELQDEYFVKVGRHYVEAVERQVWGRDAKRLRALI